jgi:hypothetical protein
MAGIFGPEPGRPGAAGLAGARAASTPGSGWHRTWPAPNDALALLLFMLALPPFTFFVSPLLAHFSRRHEFEADAYACQQARWPRPGERAAEAARGQRGHADARPAVRALLLLAPAGRRAPHHRRAAAGPRAAVERRGARPRPGGGGPRPPRRGRDARRQRVLCHPRGKKSELVVGDRVRWQPPATKASSSTIEPRRNLLFRQDEWRTKSFAANLDQVLMLVAVRAAVQRVAAGARAHRRRPRPAFRPPSA